MSLDDLKLSSNSEVVTPQSLVTQENVQAALTTDKGPNARLTAWKVVDFTKKGDNYACVVTSVEVKYELDGQNSEVVYVVKINSCKNDVLTAYMYGIVYEKESKFYCSLAPELNAVLKEIGQREVNFPKCLHVSLEKGKEIVFLEDLRPRGYKMHDHRRGMDTFHTTLVLRELARLHSASLLLEHKYPGESMTEKYPFLKKKISDMIAESGEMRKFIEDGIKLAREMLDAVGGYERAVAWIDTLTPKLAAVFYEQLESGKPKVVCHGDCWTNNLLFKYDETGKPDDIMLLDLQMVYYGSPRSKLNYLIYTSTTGDVRNPNLLVFLNYYREALTGSMEAAGQEVPFTREQLLKKIKGKKILWNNIRNDNT